MLTCAAPDNAPGPMDFMNSRSQNIPPPSKSPVKGSRNIRDSPEIASSEPEEDLSSPSDGKSLLANGNGNIPSPLSTRSVNAGPNRKSISQKSKPDTTLTEYSDDEQENASFAVDDVENSFDAGDSVVEDIHEPIEQDLDQSDSDEEAEVQAESSRQPEKMKTAAKSTKKSPVPPPTPPPAKKTDKGKGKATGRGRPPKAARAADEETEPRPAKKQKVSKESQSQPQPREPLDPELDKVVENYTQRSGPLKGRSLYILKRENPTEDASTHTRSGRVSVRPLAYWRNERCVYGDGEAAEGQRYPLSTIKEIIRTEEQEPDGKSKGKRSAGRKSKSSKSKKRKAESSDEEDENIDEWEKEDGVLHGIIPTWEPSGGTGEDVLTGKQHCMHLDYWMNSNDYCYRHRLCPVRNQNERSQRINIPIREITQFIIHRIRCCRSSTRRRQTAKEFQENAHGLLRLSRPCPSRYIRCTI